MLHDIKEFKVVLNAQGFYDIEVNGEVVSEMVAKTELAEEIEAVLKDKYGMVAEMVAEDY